MEEWKLGYSPERINPGDKVHTFRTIKKIVSGCDQESLDKIAKVYEMVVEPGVCRASSIKVAEAAKVIENSQRDINIAFMNELAMIFDKMDIDTNDVLDAAGTKWNFLHFHPGLVGGHCIGVDPYYLTYLAQNLGYTSKKVPLYQATRKFILSDNNPNHYKPKWIGAEEWWAEAKDREVLHWNILSNPAELWIGIDL